MQNQDSDPADSENVVGEEADPDHLIPPRAYQMLPVVGIGGSVGGIRALQTFLQHVPVDTGLAYVAVLHLSPEHESVLADVLQHSTSMPVLTVTETVPLEPNKVYVIPPRKALAAMDGYLQLTDLPRDRHRLVAVDLFFRTLADSHGPHAIAVVLSGMNGDGALGIKRIKERGGLTIAQEPDEAEASSMPRAAMATGMVDWVLPVAEMPDRIRYYQQLERQVRLPVQGELQPKTDTAQAKSLVESTLRDLLSFLRARTGRDFSCYKRATILRRIGRRMLVNGLHDLGAYLAFLRMHRGEAGALLQDLLISVTNFFRDTDCFAALEANIPRLFEGKGPSDSVRVWVAGCATGEEAYSIAMLLSEYARTLEEPPQIQLFATDLDEDAIRTARDGIYPATIEADVSEERLRRFFVKEDRGYRVRREMREMILFAVHDLLMDSPFSRLELVACRNLLIYLNRQAQGRVQDTFHFALQPGGMLFLGSSESVDEGSMLFSVLDKKNRLYTQRSAPRVGLPVPIGPGSLSLVLDGQQAKHVGPVTAGPVFVAQGAPYQAGARPLVGPDGHTASWGELHLKLLEYIAPPSVLIDVDYDIVHLSPSAGRFLQFGGGEPSHNLMRAIHPGLRIDLRAAAYEASQTNSLAETGTLTLELGGETIGVTMTVRPLSDMVPGLMLVTFHVNGAPQDEAHADKAAPVRTGDPLAHHLEGELERLKAHLRNTVEQYEASTEELKASNEELQAMNEELRSATEELETSREELQSINEELTTVNSELKNKVDELGHSNSDMHNLMGATAIATVFLDRELRITRYTPSAVSLFNLIPTDVGRPLSDLTTQLEYPELVEDSREVLNRLVPIEREVAQAGGRYYLVRVLPYRTLDDRIAGVVLTFVDVTERKQGQEALRLSEERFSAIVNQATVGVIQLDSEGRLTFANRCYQELLGYSEEELLGKPLQDLVHPEDRARSAELFQTLARTGEPFQAEKRCLRRDGAVIWLHNSVSFLSDAAGNTLAAVVVCTDVSERKRTEEALRISEERFRLIVENAVEYAIFTLNHDHVVTSWNVGAQRLLGYEEAEIVGQACDVIFTPQDRAAHVPEEEFRQAREEGHAGDDRVHVRKDGTQFWANGVLMPMHDASGQIVGFVKILRDQSEEFARRIELEQSRAKMAAALSTAESAHEELEEVDATKDRFLAVLAHELRNPLAAIGAAANVLTHQPLPFDKRLHTAQIVDRHAKAMKLLLDDLLDLSRLRLGRLSLQRQRVTVHSVVQSAVEMMRPLLEASGHHLKVVLPQELIVLDADPLRLTQVLSNLLSNAAKYTPDGGHIELAVEVRDNQALFSVTDDGIGMASDAVESMFGMFAQGPSINEKGVSGLGIGLALVRSIVELHHGTVRGASEGPGRGSRFTITLPLPEDSALAQPGPLLTQTGMGMASTAPINLRVLVVDDNADAAWSTAQTLEIWGCTTSTAINGQQAMAQAEQLRPDAIVLDLGLPDLHGFEVAKRIRQQPWGASILLIAATGWGQQGDKQATKDMGIDVHLVKPIEFEELKRLLQQRAHLLSTA